MKQTISEEKIRGIKESLRNYITDMFQSMSNVFMSTLQAQFQRLSQLYAKCLTERAHLQNTFQGLQNAKHSISKMLAYVDQLEDQFSAPCRQQYYQGRQIVRESEGSSSGISSRGLSNAPNNQSARRFQRKTSQNQIPINKTSTCGMEKENMGPNIGGRSDIRQKMQTLKLPKYYQS